MWTAERVGKGDAQGWGVSAGQGTVTSSGEALGVYLDGDRRWVTLYGPGGYCWRPQGGADVLVVKAGEAGESPCVVGMRQERADLKAGEVCLYSDGGARIKLDEAGAILLEGNLMVNGTAFQDAVRAIVMDILGGEMV